MAYRSNLAAVGRALHQARVAGMNAAAQQIVNRVVRGLRGGYTSGAFVTGTNTSSVVATQPQRLRGVWTVLIGTSIDDPPYPVYWELGHLNIFSGRWERKEVWGPALRDSADDAQRAFARVFRRTWEAGRALALADAMGQMDQAADD
jgi:hypothetical protein